MRFARRVHRRDEEEDEEHGEERLDRLARAGAQREPGAERAEAERDRAAAKHEEHDDPGRAGLRSGRRRPARRRCRRRAWTTPSTTTPASWPARSAEPRIGVSESRLRKPVWMSRARSVPAFIVEKSAPWMNGTASANARNESVGKPGSSVDERSPPAFTSMSATGKTSGGMTLAGWRERADDRSAARSRRPASSPCSPPARAPARRSRPPRRRPRASGPVFARKTSSSVGACSSRSAMSTPFGVDARARCRRARAPRRSRTATSRVDAERLAELREERGDLRAIVLGARGSRARSAARSRPSAPRACPRRRCCPWSMIPTRSASTSASSRYCVVRNTVTPVLACAGARPRPRARCGSAGRARSSARRGRGSAGGARARARGRAGASCRPSSRATLRSAASLEPDAVEQLLGARLALAAAGCPAASPAGAGGRAPVSSGSSAASCSAAPIEPRAPSARP